MSEYEKMNEMTDVELFHIIKNPSCKLQYNKAFATLYNRYHKLLDKQWGILVKQLNCGWTNNYKEDFYSLASEAFMQAIDRTDEARIDENYKFVQMISWLVGNVRINLIKSIIKKESMLESVYGVDKDSESKLTIKPRVEWAYYRREGFMEQPEYAYEKLEKEELLSLSVENCKAKWSVTKKQIFVCASKGLPNKEIAKELNIPPKTVTHMMSLMKKEIKKELSKQAMKKEYI